LTVDDGVAYRVEIPDFVLEFCIGVLNADGVLALGNDNPSVVSLGFLSTVMPWPTCTVLVVGVDVGLKSRFLLCWIGEGIISKSGLSSREVAA